MQPGAGFGELSFADGSPALATVTAESRIEVDQLPDAALEAFLGEAPDSRDRPLQGALPGAVAAPSHADGGAPPFDDGPGDVSLLKAEGLVSFLTPTQSVDGAHQSSIPAVRFRRRGRCHAESSHSMDRLLRRDVLAGHRCDPRASAADLSRGSAVLNRYLDFGRESGLRYRDANAISEGFFDWLRATHPDQYRAYEEQEALLAARTTAAARPSSSAPPPP